MNDTEVLLKDGGLYVIKKEQLEYWAHLYPQLDIQSEIAILKYNWEHNVIQRRTSKNINKYINKALYNANKEYQDEYF